MKQITFNQWKALSAFCRDCTKLEMVNNKVKSLVDPIDYVFDNTPNTIDLNKLTPAQLESYLQNESKNQLSADMNRVIEEAFADRYKITKEGKAIKLPKSN
jgi:hypothetical protein